MMTRSQPALTVQAIADQVDHVDLAYKRLVAALARWKIRGDLRRDPRYCALLEQLGLFECSVCGRLANASGCLDRHCSQHTKHRRIGTPNGLSDQHRSQNLVECKVVGAAQTARGLTPPCGPCTEEESHGARTD